MNVVPLSDRLPSGFVTCFRVTDTDSFHHPLYCMNSIAEHNDLVHLDTHHLPCHLFTNINIP